jgi:glycogen debranching enzyme
MSEDITLYQTLILFDGSTFFFSDPNGDVQAEGAEGYFHDDVRHLSLWRLLIDGQPLRGITSRAVDYYAARIACTSEPEDPPFSVRRDRFVTEGVHEDIVLTNHQNRELKLRLELHFDADFADIFEAQQAPQQCEVGKRSVACRERRGASLRSVGHSGHAAPPRKRMSRR